MECIILAGGLGTRLQGVVQGPKCMAPLNGSPFLHYLFNYLEKQDCTHAILSLGHKSETVIGWLYSQDLPFEVDIAIETEPLGTGGGIALAMQRAMADNVAVLNGDTMFDVNLQELLEFHNNKKASATLALKEMQNFDRYGVVNTDGSGCITSFEEKKHRDKGLINGGVYVINREAFLKKNMPDMFSFEKQYLEAFVGEKQFYGFKRDAYFIDIGIPADYEQAQSDFKTLFRCR